MYNVYSLYSQVSSSPRLTTSVVVYQFLDKKGHMGAH